MNKNSLISNQHASNGRPHRITNIWIHHPHNANNSSLSRDGTYRIIFFSSPAPINYSANIPRTIKISIPSPQLHHSPTTFTFKSFWSSLVSQSSPPSYFSFSPWRRFNLGSWELRKEVCYWVSRFWFGILGSEPFVRCGWMLKGLGGWKLTEGLCSLMMPLDVVRLVELWVLLLPSLSLLSQVFFGSFPATASAERVNIIQCLVHYNIVHHVPKLEEVIQRTSWRRETIQKRRIWRPRSRRIRGESRAIRWRRKRIRWSTTTNGYARWEILISREITRESYWGWTLIEMSMCIHVLIMVVFHFWNHWYEESFLRSLDPLRSSTSKFVTRISAPEGKNSSCRGLWSCSSNLGLIQHPENISSILSLPA
jgi:hypothetical protein